MNFKDFIPKFVCVLTNKRYKHIKRGFHSFAWVMPQGGSWGAGDQTFIFSEHGHVAYQIEGVMSRTGYKYILA